MSKIGYFLALSPIVILSPLVSYAYGLPLALLFVGLWGWGCLWGGVCGYLKGEDTGLSEGYAEGMKRNEYLWETSLSRLTDRAFTPVRVIDIEDSYDA